MNFLPTVFRSKTLVCLALASLMVSGLQAVSTIDGAYKSITASATNLVALDFNNDIYLSDDDGATFTQSFDTSTLFGGKNESFNEIEALGTTVIAVGVDGLILRSTDDGAGWVVADSPTIFVSLFGLAARTNTPDPNEWLAVGDDDENGVIVFSEDDGATWAEVETLANISLEDAIWTGNRWLACGMDDFFEGVVFASTDGTTWAPSSVPLGTSPLLAMATDGNGVVLAVGEEGQILRSTDDGLSFSEIASQYKGGGAADLRAVIADSSGTFFVGGDEKLIIEIIGTSATTRVPSAVTAPPVRDFVLINDVASAIGSFPESTERTIPFGVAITSGGSLDFILSVEQTLVGKNYYVETTTDLTANDWTIIPGTAVNGNGGSLIIEVSQDEPKRFWRVVEF